MLNLNFKPFPSITTARLILRKIDQNDVNEIFFLRSDKKVLQYLDRPPAESINEAAEWIQKINDAESRNDLVTWAICFQDDSKLIGTICFWNIAKEHHRAEIGYALHPDHQGKGIMQEALSEVVKYGFEIMKLHSIEANVNPGNTSSMRLLERNHFTREGWFKENFYYNGKFLDTLIYSLLTHIR